jgi:type VI secretion system secreted protein Hcp
VEEAEASFRLEDDGFERNVTRRSFLMRKKLIWVAVAAAIVVTPALIGVLALGGDDSRRSGALIQPGTGGYELVLAGLNTNGQALKLESYSWGGNAPIDAATGAASGRAKLSELSVSKKVDSATPLLMKGLTLGTKYPTATLTLYKGEKTQKYMEYKLTNVTISSVQHGGAADDIPNEQVSFAYTKLETTVEDQDGDGKVTTNTMTWDLQAAKAQ